MTTFGKQLDNYVQRTKGTNSPCPHPLRAIIVDGKGSKCTDCGKRLILKSDQPDEIAALRAENAKLREALEKVAKVTALRGSDAEFGIDHLRELARRTLEAK